MRQLVHWDYPKESHQVLVFTVGTISNSEGNGAFFVGYIATVDLVLVRSGFVLVRWRGRL